MPIAPAPHLVCPSGRYGALVVGGPEAASFLQGQLTRDVLALGAGEAGLAALLTPQGRVIAVPWLAPVAAGYALVVPAALAEPLRARLARYVLRAKVTLAVAALEPALGARIAATLAAHDEPDAAAAEPEARFVLALIRAGVPEIGAATSEEWIPQMLNLDLLGAISFQKGCYTGQEIVARTQHLGRIKRRMFRLATARPPAVKDGVLGDGRKVGEVVLAAAVAGRAQCLAVLNLESRSAPLALEDGAGCRILPLPYALS